MRKQILTHKQKKKNAMRRLAIKVAAYFTGLFIVIFLGYYCVNNFGCQTVIIDQSMNSILQSEDVVLVNKMTKALGGPKRMDIVTLKIGTSESSPSYVRRIIGTPGDTVLIKEGKIFVNDEEVTITFNNEIIKNPGVAEEGITLEDDNYFVICDDYNNYRDDSRLDSIGTITSEQITGKVWFRISPIGRFGFIK